MSIYMCKHITQIYRFYELAKQAAIVVQSDDSALYANAIIYKGVL